MHTLVSTNPARGYASLGAVPVSAPAEIATAVDRARKAQKSWSAQPLEARVSALRLLVDLLAARREAVARAVSTEMGQPITLSHAHVGRAVEDFAWKLDNAPAILGDEVLPARGRVAYEPWGVAAVIMAWNFPVPNFGAAFGAALAGNTVVAKYSEEIPLFGKLMEGLCAEAGIPDDTIRFVTGDGEVGQRLIDQDIDFVSFTGSFKTGHCVYRRAADKFIPAVLELGGSSPGIVFADADLGAALAHIFEARFSNSGQFCSNIKRLIVHQDVFDDVVARLTGRAEGAALGDPLDPETVLGPLVAERQVVALEVQVADALDKGATLHCGGVRPSKLNGAFYAPTILTDITPEMAVWREEVFGPVLPVVAFDTYEEALRLANDTKYGLTGYVYTRDRALAERALREIRAGCVSANGASFMHPQNPFGGHKHSGLGRERGRWGLRAACQTKVIAI